MNLRRNLYVSGGVAASASYLFIRIATEGELDLLLWAGFMALYFIIMFGFEKFVDWAERFD